MELGERVLSLLSLPTLPRTLHLYIDGQNLNQGVFVITSSIVSFIWGCYSLGVWKTGFNQLLISALITVSILTSFVTIAIPFGAKPVQIGEIRIFPVSPKVKDKISFLVPAVNLTGCICNGVDAWIEKKEGPITPTKKYCDERKNYGPHSENTFNFQDFNCTKSHENCLMTVTVTVDTKYSHQKTITFDIDN